VRWRARCQGGGSWFGQFVVSRLTSSDWPEPSSTSASKRPSVAEPKTLTGPTKLLGVGLPTSAGPHWQSSLGKLTPQGRRVDPDGLADCCE
jgi:hypothetical protein